MIGCGNPTRGDDGAGSAVAERLRGRPGLVVLTACEPGPDLCDRWTPDDDVVLVDAARSGAAPGTIHRLDALASALPAALLRVSTHGNGLAQAVELARVLGRLPAGLRVYAIEGARFGPGDAPSPAVARAVEQVVEELCTRPA